MKVIIDGKQTEFTSIFPAGDHIQANEKGNVRAHSFNMHPKHYPKDKEIKTNGHIYIFPSR